MNNEGISQCFRSDVEYPFNVKMLKFQPDDGNDVPLHFGEYLYSVSATFLFIS